jgi:competence protein ComEC
MGPKRQTYIDHLLFPGVIIGCWVTGFYLKSVLLFILAAYFIFVLLLKKHFVIVLLCFVGSFLLGLRMVTFQNHSLEEGPLTTELLVYSDTIKINGDLVTFEGKLPAGKVMGRYQVASFAEKEQWMIRQHWQKYLRIQGEFKEAETSRNKHAFDYSFYLSGRNFLGTVTIKEIVASKPDTGIFSVRKWRAAAVTHVQQFFPQRLATYINALLFGYKDQEFQEIRQLFSSSGLLHFFTVSGMHITFFFTWVEKGLRRGKFTKEGMRIPVLVLILTAAVFFGGTISVIRGVLSYGTSFFLSGTSWRLSACDRYGIVLFLTLLIDPKVFMQTAGQLSFLMTFLLLMQKTLNHSVKHALFLPILAAPFMMYAFYEFPLVGGLLTLLVLPLFKGLLLPLFSVFFTISLFLPEMPKLGQGIEQVISIGESVIASLGNISLITGSIPIGLAIGCMLAGLFFYQRRQWIICLLFSLLFPLLSQRLFVPSAVTFVDVGQGDSIVLQTAFNQEVYVIDTGGSLSFPRERWQQRSYQANAHYSLIPFLQGEGIKQIDGLFLTHGDTDHMGDARALMTAIPVKKVYLVPGSEDHPQIAALIKQLPKGTTVHWTKVGETIGKNLSITVLAPESGAGENEDSLVLKAEVEKNVFLLTGDLDQTEEEKLIQEYPQLQTDVLKLGHHGSRTATSPRFVESTSPKIGIISCGKDNRYGHPHDEVLEAMEGRRILRTDQQGMIRFSWSNWRSVQRLETWLDYPLE